MVEELQRMAEEKLQSFTANSRGKVTGNSRIRVTMKPLCVHIHCYYSWTLPPLVPGIGRTWFQVAQPLRVMDTVSLTWCSTVMDNLRADIGTLRWGVGVGVEAPFCWARAAIASSLLCSTSSNRSDIPSNSPFAKHLSVWPNGASVMYT